MHSSVTNAYQAALTLTGKVICLAFAAGLANITCNITCTIVFLPKIN